MTYRKIIPYGHQSIDMRDIEAVSSALRADFITQGKKVGEFERVVANYVGAKYAVAFNSGTSALVAACFAAEISASDEVITTPYTFAATSNCFVWFGAEPVFVDIDPETLNIDPENVERAINKKTKALVTVDFAGLPCDYNKLLKIAKKNKLILIEDAAHSLGSEYFGKKVGSFADMTCFSFHPVKTITTGEGGMVVTNSKKYYEALLIFRSHGMVKERAKLLNKELVEWYYEMQELGLNFRLTDFQAALGISQMKRINRFILRRREIVEIYNESFKNLPVMIPDDLAATKTAWHLYPVRIDLEKLRVSRKIVFGELRKAGIGVQVHYIPVHLHPYYRERFGFKKGDFPNSERAYDSEISLPLFFDLTIKDVEFIVNVVKDVIGKYFKKAY